MASCPICEKPVKPRSENSAFPFCSARCKTIDLGKWLSEEYRVGHASQGEGEGQGEVEGEAAESDPPPKAPVRH